MKTVVFTSGLEESQSATAVRMIVDHWFGVFQPPPRMTVSEWAEEFRFLSPETCSNPGKFASELTPWAIEWMDSAVDPTATGTVLMVASQLGKTESLNNVVGFFIHIEPATILVVQPTEGLGEQWSKERLEPMIRDTPALYELVAESKTRNSGNTIAFKSYPGGNIAIAGANAPSGLAGRPRRVVLLDEEDRYPFSAGKEGDPASLAIRRTETFYNAVVFETSTPTVKGLSRIEARWEQSDKRRWWVLCPRCEYSQVFAWTQVRWEAPDGADAYYECAGCKAPLTDTERRKMSKAGRWIAEHPDRTIRGFHLNGIASLFRHKRGYKNRLHQMVAGHLEAKAKGPEAYRTWVNTFLAETYEEEGETVEWEPLFKRRYAALPEGEVPEGVQVITAGVDFQGDRIELEIVGWNEQEESWSIAYVVIIGNPDDAATLIDLDRQLQRKFKHPSGVELKISAALVDSGHKTKTVYAFTRPRAMRKVFAVKGKGGPGMPVLSRPRRIGNPRVTLYTVGTDTAKDSIYARLALPSHGPGYMHFPDTLEEDYFQQLTVEQRITSYADGKPYHRFVNPSKARNEALDCRVYAMGALALANPNWKAIQAALSAKKTEEEKAAPAAPPAAKRPAARRTAGRGGGFATNW